MKQFLFLVSKPNLGPQAGMFVLVGDLPWFSNQNQNSQLRAVPVPPQVCTQERLLVLVNHPLK